MPEVLWSPNPGPQTAFLASTAREVLFGGAVAGGKSDALIVLPLRFADHPKHRAIIMRRTRPQLQEVIDRTIQLYPQVVPGAVWREAEARWKFPSGAIIQMGYAEHEEDIYHQKSFEYNLICFDELTTFTEKQYTFMFLRNRTKSPDLPTWIRSATNPGDVGHEWVYARFLTRQLESGVLEDRKPYVTYQEQVGSSDKPATITRQFIPSFIWDNPALPNRDEYLAGIMGAMSPEEVGAYVYGQWTRLQGAMFKKAPVEATERRLLDPQNYYVVRGIDFGTYDPTCIIWLVHYPKVDIVDVVDEAYIKDNVTIDGVAATVKAREKALGLAAPVASVGSPEMKNIEPTSGQSISSMLTRAGVTVDKANTDRVAGWTHIQNLLQHGRLRVWPGAAPNLLRTIGRLQRNPKKPEDVIQKVQDDHAADALRYALMAVYDRPAEFIGPPKDEEKWDPNRDEVFDKLMSELKRPARENYYADLGVWDV